MKARAGRSREHLFKRTASALILHKLAHFFAFIQNVRPIGTAETLSQDSRISTAKFRRLPTLLGSSEENLESQEGLILLTATLPRQASALNTCCL
jgi:hypothetical protein